MTFRLLKSFRQFFECALDKIEQTVNRKIQNNQKNIMKRKNPKNKAQNEKSLYEQ